MWNRNTGEVDTTKLTEACAMLMEESFLRAMELNVTQITVEYLLFVLLSGPKNAKLRQNTDFAKVQTLLNAAFTQGVTRAGLLGFLEETLVRGGQSPDFFHESAYDVPMLEALEEASEGDLFDLCAALLRAIAKLSPDMKDALSDMLNIGPCVEALLGARNAAEAAAFDADGALRFDSFSPRMGAMIQAALVAAAETMHSEVKSLHIFYAMLRDNDGYAAIAAGRCSPGFSVRSALPRLKARLTRGSGAAEVKLPENESAFSPYARDALKEAARSAVLRAHAGERDVLIQLLRTPDPVFQDCLASDLDLAPAVLLQTTETLPEPEQIFVSLPSDICECAVLTDRSGEPVIGRDALVEEVIKALLRKRQSNVALYGEAGVGKTAMAQAIADGIKRLNNPQVRMTPVVYLDLNAIPERELENRLQSLFDYMASNENRIYIVDKFSRALLSHTEMCRTYLTRNQYKFVAIIDAADMEKLSGGKDDGRNYLTFMEVPEPGAGDMQTILKNRLPGLAKELGVPIEPSAVDATLRFCQDYLINRKFPRKAFELLTTTADDVLADIAMHGGEITPVTKERLARQVSREVGLPLEVVLGTGDDRNFNDILSRYVVGQQTAVVKVAERMEFIQKSLVDKKRPAAIFVFAGLSGTGKTELAKAIAQIYATSRKLVTYAMADLGAEHSVSRLIGSPPGYIGYEAGGPLINDLNRDPYAVFLLDEIEKAHPSVWDPFLNLFDEGVITDQKGITAYASKAFFALTTNIGQYDIARMLKAGEPLEAIEETVVKGFGEATFHKNNNLKCFRPEFIGRIIRSGGIVVFNSLSLEAHIGICRHMASKMITEFKGLRDFELIIDDDVIDMIGTKAFEQNELSIAKGDKYFGGRTLDPIFDKLVKGKLSREMNRLAEAKVVKVMRSGDDTKLEIIMGEDDAAKLREERRQQLAGQVVDALDTLSLVDSGAVSRCTYQQLVKLSGLLGEANGIVKR